jgi:plastocyanin
VSEFRKRVVEPALIPLVAFAFIGALAYAVSRILLAVTTEGSVVVATLMAAGILFAAAAVAKGGTLKKIQKISLIAFTLLLFGGGIAVEASLGPREVEKHLEVLEEPLIAEQVAFKPTEVHVPPDQSVGLRFENRDAAVAHNVAVFRDPEFQQNLFRGDLFPGVATRVYELPALPAGVYSFLCDVHPGTMRGTLISGEEQGGPPPSPPQPSGTPSPGAGNPAGPIDLIAKNTAFDKTTLTFPHGAQVTINLRNDDPLPHNWSLYTDQTFTPPALFPGEIFTGPAERKYVFTAPATPGTYAFKCDVHANMTGTAIVT